MSITIFIIIATVLASLSAFNNASIRDRAIFYPYGIQRRNEFFRFITSGFIHADWFHLLINMYVLYSFGELLEKYFLPAFFPNSARLVFLCIYFLGMIIADVPSYIKHRNDPTYRALGASGAVSAIVFACILFVPWPEDGGIQLFFIPIDIPPVIFGVLYLIYSAYMGRRGQDNIGHDAHFYGAVFGFIFPIILQPSLFTYFIDQIQERL
ncbi:MAG: rhomboid family intramembrane serine protease [Chitinophagales bacterium]|nr:rhomboid family intramembrane serine protease [Chitinophagales bacterium]